MHRQFARYPTPSILLLAVVAATACQKSTTPQAVPSLGPTKASPQKNERNPSQLTDFPESSLTPAHTVASGELQGTWRVTEFHTAQGSSTVEEGLIIPYTFEGNKLITVGPGNIRVEMEYRLDPTRAPQEIDQRFTGGTIGPWIGKGIYKLEGDTLTICYGDHNVARPTEFTARPGDGRTMIVHKRLK